MLLALLTIILFWKDGAPLRLYFAGSFALYAVILILTFAYFIPRDLILFSRPISDHIDTIRTAASQWKQMNWVRTALGLSGVVLSLKGLDTYYRTLLRMP